MNRKTFIIGFLLLAGLLIAYVAAACWPARVTLTTHQSKPFEFRIQKNFRVDHIMNFAIWREGEDNYLWFLDFGNSSVTSVSYGIRPQGVEQRYPHTDGTPSPLSRGDILFVIVNYQYDSAIPPAACAGSIIASFTVTEEGALESLDLPQTWTYPKNYPQYQAVLDASGEHSDHSPRDQ